MLNPDGDGEEADEPDTVADADDGQEAFEMGTFKE